MSVKNKIYFYPKEKLKNSTIIISIIFGVILYFNRGYKYITIALLFSFLILIYLYYKFIHSKKYIYVDLQEEIISFGKSQKISFKNIISIEYETYMDNKYYNYDNHEIITRLPLFLIPSAWKVTQKLDYQYKLTFITKDEKFSIDKLDNIDNYIKIFKELNLPVCE